MHPPSDRGDRPDRPSSRRSSESPASPHVTLSVRTGIALLNGGLALLIVLALALNADALLHVLPRALSAVTVLLALALVRRLIASFPRHWARQGVAVDDTGIVVFREPMWWARGERTDIAWEDLHHFDTHEILRRNRLITLVQLHLNRADPDLGLPDWARLVMPGESAWSLTASVRPVLVIDLSWEDAHEMLLGRLKRARPDLAREEVAERALRDHEERIRSAPTPPAHIPTTLLDPRRPMIGRWAIGATLLTPPWLAWGFMIHRFVQAPSWDPVSLLIVFSVLLLLGSAWSIRAAPGHFTRQSVRIDASGVTFTQHSLLWLDDRAAHLPWEKVHMVGLGQADVRNDRFLRVVVHRTAELSALPTWCRFDDATDADDPHALITIALPKRTHALLCHALREARPDLMVTV